MALVGLTAIMLGGCPLRQLILSGSGDSDATLTVLGMIAGAGLSHNAGMAGSPAGVELAGKLGVIIGLIISIAIAISYTSDIKKHFVESKSSEISK